MHPRGVAARISRADFTDVDQLGEATREANVEMAVVGGRRYHGEMLDLETEDVGIQWGFHSVPMIARGQVWENGGVLTRWGTGACARCNGEALGAGAVLYPPGSELQVRTEGSVGWVSLRVSRLAQLVATLAPDVSRSGGRIYHVDGTLEAVGALRRVLLDARRAADRDAESLRDAAVRWSLRELLATAVARLAGAGRPHRLRENSAACSALVRRAEEVMRARAFQPMYVPELCAAVDASEARLRDAFQRVFGVGPSRYLRLRRLHLVRRSLRSTRKQDLTVSAAAARFGFFEFGRFAGEYRWIFGELPSHTHRAL
ncbi:MAG TPA: helix-turn-helix domain-containing protein [Anaeromyxobacteraceae bacterium]|nr:helix-turn-helix domain-containing protein [Anaeromyxobacteraceae bacterium]